MRLSSTVMNYLMVVELSHVAFGAVYVNLDVHFRDNGEPDYVNNELIWALKMAVRDDCDIVERMPWESNIYGDLVDE